MTQVQIKRNKYGAIVNEDLTDLERYRTQIRQSKDRDKAHNMEERLIELEDELIQLSSKIDALVRKIDG